MNPSRALCPKLLVRKDTINHNKGFCCTVDARDRICSVTGHWSYQPVSSGHKILQSSGLHGGFFTNQECCLQQDLTTWFLVEDAQWRYWLCIWMQVSAFGGDEQSDSGDHWKYVWLLNSLSALMCKYQTYFKNSADKGFWVCECLC